MTRSTSPNSPPSPAAGGRTGAKPSDQPAVGTSPAAPGSAAPQDGERLGMPHERDQSTGDTAAEPHDSMQQAKKDIDAGQVDTDLHNTGGAGDAHRDELLKRER